MNLETYFIRLENDNYGNPIYYISVLDLARLVGVEVDRLVDVAKVAGFRKYRGKKYGTGYVVQSYSLTDTVAQLRKALKAAK